MSPRTGKRPVNLTVAIVILWIQAVTNGSFGTVIILSAQSDMEHGRDAGLALAAGLISVVVAPVLVVGAVALARRRAWAQVPVLVMEVLIIVSGLVQVALTLAAGGPPSSIIGLVLAGLVLQGVLSKEPDAWLHARDVPDEDPRAESRDVAREP